MVQFNIRTARNTPKKATVIGNYTRSTNDMELASTENQGISCRQSTTRTYENVQHVREIFATGLEASVLVLNPSKLYNSCFNVTYLANLKKKSVFYIKMTNFRSFCLAHQTFLVLTTFVSFSSSTSLFKSTSAAYYIAPAPLSVFCKQNSLLHLSKRSRFRHIFSPLTCAHGIINTHN